MNKTKIAILGYGVIGKGIFEICKNIEYIEVVKILERKERFDEKYLDLFTDNIDEIINNEEIKIIVEVLGGYDFAKSVIVKSLEAKKCVVTANKEVIAKDIDSLILLSKNNNVELAFEASVGGGIPIIKNIKELVKINKISKISGILNGTTNYILTKMHEGISFNDALKDAQQKGFAELDPTADLEGYDMMRKIAILSDLAWNTYVDINKVKHQGISNIKESDIKEALKKNKVIKFVCESTLVNGNINIEVTPKVFDNNHFFSNVNNEFNAVILETYPNDVLTFIGKGAGSMPTASAVVLDVIQIIENKHENDYQNINKYIINSEV